MPQDTQHSEIAPAKALFPLSPEMLRRLFDAHDTRVLQRDHPITPETDRP